MDCSYCKRTINNVGSLKAHEKYCKLNPNREEKPSNFILYNKKIKSGELTKQYTNQHVKAKELGYKLPISESTRLKISNANKNRLWTTEQKLKHSTTMRNAVKNNPDSYSKNNVVGRVRNIEYRGIKLKGSWELIFAKWLDQNNIEWKHEAKGFEYQWKGTRLYFPDFYLPNFDLYIEVKGYETERDRCKWKVVGNLTVIKKKDIDDIKKGVFTLTRIGSRS